ncbi:MAG: glycoside hydrolase 43 family protein [Bacteroidales bacterium]|nr:glycoside hydrolase 43 family protein [Bacteroidales bacterium]
MKKSPLLLLLFVAQLQAQQWTPDLGNGKYKNPVIWADYSDPDVIKVGDDFYMTASSFNCVPALPVLHSTDLVNWELINHAVKRFPDSYFDIVQHGNGVWAPSLRFHDGWFYIYWGDPDRGVFMVRTQDPKGEWSQPVLVKKAYGNIDVCPLWDDDGKVYMVHAFANSRAGASNIVHINELNSDGSSILQKRMVIINGYPNHNTLEGPKYYKRNGYYYIFAPAGGVATGYQVVFRSKDIWGPYEERIVLTQGNTKINGPHQGGWVELDNGENWFIHFQELQPYGRITHLQPVKWIDDWPVMGSDEDKNGTGEPVLEYQKPKVNKPSEIKIPQTTDEFDNDKLSLTWQWQANYFDHWYSLDKKKGSLRLYAQYNPNSHSLWMVPNMLLQKFPAPVFSATTKINVTNLKNGEKAGLIIMGLDYASLLLSPSKNGYELSFATCKKADTGADEKVQAKVQTGEEEIYLKVNVDQSGKCRFAYSKNGKDFEFIGETFQAREGKWIGAKVGLLAISGQETGLKGFADFEWFRIE